MLFCLVPACPGLLKSQRVGRSASILFAKWLQSKRRIVGPTLRNGIRRGSARSLITRIYWRRWQQPKPNERMLFVHTLRAGGPNYPFKLWRVPRPSFAWAGPFHHKLRSQSSQTGKAAQAYVVPCPGDYGVFRKPASYTSSPSAVTKDDQTSRTLRLGLRSKPLSNGYENATDFACTAMS